MSGGREGGIYGQIKKRQVVVIVIHEDFLDLVYIALGFGWDVLRKVDDYPKDSDISDPSIRACPTTVDI